MSAPKRCAQVVQGDLTDLASMHRAIEGCARIYFGMSVSAAYLEQFRRVLFNYLIGNADAHAKIFSLLYRDGVPTFAPGYDLVCTRIYELSTSFAMHHGGIAEPEAMTEAAWIAVGVTFDIDAAGDRSAARDLGMRAVPAARVLINERYRELPPYDRILAVIGERVDHLAAALDFPSNANTAPLVLKGGGWRWS